MTMQELYNAMNDWQALSDWRHLAPEQPWWQKEPGETRQLIEASVVESTDGRRAFRFSILGSEQDFYLVLSTQDAALLHEALHNMQQFLQPIRKPHVEQRTP